MADPDGTPENVLAFNPNGTPANSYTEQVVAMVAAQQMQAHLHEGEATDSREPTEQQLPQKIAFSLELAKEIGNGALVNEEPAMEHPYNVIRSIALDEQGDETDTAILLQNVRDNATKIRALLEAPRTKDATENNMYIWRALFYTHGRAVSAAIIDMTPPGAPRIIRVAVVQHFDTFGSIPAAQYIQDTGMQPEEIAVFLGLDEVPSSDVNWVMQKVISSNLAVVRDMSALPQIHQNGR